MWKARHGQPDGDDDGFSGCSIPRRGSVADWTLAKSSNACGDFHMLAVVANLENSSRSTGRKAHELFAWGDNSCDSYR